MGRLTITPEMIDLALQAKDLIGQLLEADNPAELESPCAEVVKALAKFLPHQAGTTSSGSKKPVASAAGKRRHQIFFKPHPEVFFSGTDPVNLVDELCTLGEGRVVAKVDGVPPLDSLNPEQCCLAWQVELVSSQPLGQIKEVFLFVEDESELRIESEPESAAVEFELEGPLAAFLNLAEQSLEAIGGFVLQLQTVAEPDPAIGRNFLRILKTFRSAARQKQQETAAGLFEEQIGLLEMPGDGQVSLSDEAKQKLAELHKKLAAVIQSLRLGNGRATEPQAPSATPASLRDHFGVPVPTGGLFLLSWRHRRTLQATT